MTAISQQWWEQLTPKIMHRRRRELEMVLGKWAATDYGRHWLAVAMKPQGIIRVTSGQFIPNFHAIALGDGPIFVTPQALVKPAHRTVNSNTDFKSGELHGGELAVEPQFIFDMVADPALIAAARRGDTGRQVLGVKEPSLVFSIPAHLLLAPTHYPKRSYVIYQHIFGDGGSYPMDGYFYVGVTTRSWQDRWSEHRRAMENGSPLLFHRKLREELGASRVTYIHHKVMAITDDLEELYTAEEFLVRGHWDDARRLNMIPGGKSGLKYLRENGLLSKNATPLPDERDRLVSRWLEEHPRKGLPAPWVSDKWKDDAWAIAQICGRDDRLSQDQVRSIRELSNTYTAEVIAERIGARNAEQVKRVIQGRTYSRVQ